MELTREQIAEVQSAAHAVWQYIGSDYMALGAGTSISRAEVLEAVSDAGRLEEELKRRMRDGSGLITPELIEEISKMDYKKLLAMLKPAFKYARYE